MRCNNSILLIYQHEDIENRVRKSFEINGLDLTSTPSNTILEDSFSLEGKYIQLILVEMLKNDDLCRKIIEYLKMDANLISIPVLLLTDNDIPFDRLKWFNLGVIGFITKPYDSDTSIGQIHSLINQFGLIRRKSSLAECTNINQLERKFRQKINENQKMAFSLIKINNFDVFCQKYGFDAGSDVILEFLALLKVAVNDKGGSDDIVNLLSWDNFVLLTEAEKIDDICSYVIEIFEKEFGLLHYNEEDRDKGTVTYPDREGTIKHSFNKLHIGTVTNVGRDIANLLEAFHIVNGLLNGTKKDSNKSYHLKDKRTG